MLTSIDLAACLKRWGDDLGRCNDLAPATVEGGGRLVATRPIPGATT